MSYLDERGVTIALPREVEMEEVDTGSPVRWVDSLSLHTSPSIYYYNYYISNRIMLMLLIIYTVHIIMGNCMQAQSKL